MNVAFFIKPKQDTAYLYSDFSIRQALEKMKICGYTAIPVISREGKYVGTVSEGDFLWLILKEGASLEDVSLIKELEHIPVTKIIKSEKYKAVNFSENIEKLFNMALEQNFVPVVDDLGSFSGIVTRRSILSYLMNTM